jgi:predicted small metal-binding protein
MRCRDSGQNCDWKATAENDEEVLRQAAHLGQQKHGMKDFAEDIHECLQAKIRDVKSTQVRGNAR